MIRLIGNLFGLIFGWLVLCGWTILPACMLWATMQVFVPDLHQVWIFVLAGVFAASYMIYNVSKLETK